MRTKTNSTAFTSSGLKPRSANFCRKFIAILTALCALEGMDFLSLLLHIKTNIGFCYICENKGLFWTAKAQKSGVGGTFFRLQSPEFYALAMTPVPDVAMTYFPL
jgi:hypothetical protein